MGPADLGPVDFAEWLEDEIDSIRILGRTLTLTVDTSALPPGLRVQLDRTTHVVSLGADFLDAWVSPERMTAPH